MFNPVIFFKITWHILYVTCSFSVKVTWHNSAILVKSSVLRHAEYSFSIKKNQIIQFSGKKRKTLNNCFIKRHSAHATEHAHMVPPHFLLHPNAIISFAYLRPYDCMPNLLRHIQFGRLFNNLECHPYRFRSHFISAQLQGSALHLVIFCWFLYYLAFHFQVQCQGCILYTVWIIYTIMMITIWEMFHYCQESQNLEITMKMLIEYYVEQTTY